jgi:hypothetical protein
MDHNHNRRGVPKQQFQHLSCGAILYHGTTDIPIERNQKRHGQAHGTLFPVNPLSNSVGWHTAPWSRLTRSFKVKYYRTTSHNAGKWQAPYLRLLREALSTSPPSQLLEHLAHRIRARPRFLELAVAPLEYSSVWSLLHNLRVIRCRPESRPGSHIEPTPHGTRREPRGLQRRKIWLTGRYANAVVLPKHLTYEMMQLF